MTPLMVTIRFEGDAEELFPKWQRAVELWKEEFGDRGETPSTVVAEGEHGGLVIVNVFSSDEAHKAFGRDIGGPMGTVGLSGPQLEHLNVRHIDFRE